MEEVPGSIPGQALALALERHCFFSSQLRRRYVVRLPPEGFSKTQSGVHTSYDTPDDAISRMFREISVHAVEVHDPGCKCERTSETAKQVKTT